MAAVLAVVAVVVIVDVLCTEAGLLQAEANPAAALTKKLASST